MGSDRVFRWRTSSFTSSGADCVEVSWTGAVRDSKDPDSPVLRADLVALVGAIKAGLLGD
jgi:hypothetical protein